LDGKEKPSVYFDESEASQIFHDSFYKCLDALYRKSVSEYLPTENLQSLKHGGEFSHPGAPQAFMSGMREHRTAFSIKHEELLDHDLGVIPRAIESVLNQMRKSFAETMYSTISDSCDLSGNVVDAKAEGSAPAAFLKMLETIEFTADKDGNVRLPQIHMGPEAFDTFMTQMKDVSPDMESRIEAVKAEKIKKAQDAEISRKARFLKYGDSE
jgi:hypothetical protein